MTTHITQPSTENTQRLASFNKGSAIRTRKQQGNPMAKMGRGVRFSPPASQARALRAGKLTKLVSNF